MKVLFYIVTLFSAIPLWSQDISGYKTRFPGAQEMVIKNKKTYHFELKKAKPYIFSDHYYESMILSDAGVQNNTESFYYSDLVPLKTFEGYTLIKNKDKEKKIEINSVSDKSSSSDHVFYSDAKEKTLVFNHLEVGAKKVYSYQTEFLDHHLLHQFSFASHLPVNESELELVVHKGIDIGFKVFNDDENEVVMQKTESKNKTVYSWKKQNINGLSYESNDPGFLHKAPHIIVFVKNYKSDSGVVPVLGSTDLLYSYYQNFVKSLNKVDDPELKKIALQLTEGLMDDQQKIKKIYYWVKDHIKYIAFENGYEGFIPRNASLVFERRFGDCKDMSSIITDMARYADIPGVNLCWIGTRRIPYRYDEIPTPAVDDHMIASFQSGETFIFLDATDKETSFGLPSSFIQGKEAMVQQGKSYKIVEVPVVSPELNTKKDSVVLHLTNTNTLVGEGLLSLHGLNRSYVLSVFGDASGDKRKDRIKSLVLKGNNKFSLNRHTELNVSDRDKPYQLSYFFDLNNYVVHADKEWYISLFLERPYLQNIIEAGRKSKYSFEILQKEEYIFELNITNDFMVKSLPQDVVFENDLMYYHIDYTQNENKVILKFDITNKKLMLEPKDFDVWNETIKKLKAAYTENIVLVKKD